MKTVKTANGVKKIEECAEPVALLKIREILTDHRNILINRLILDIPAYIGYRINAKPGKEQLQSITERLYSLKHSPIDPDKYDSLIQTILSSNSTHLSGEIFYKEIDTLIHWELNHNQIALMK